MMSLNKLYNKKFSYKHLTHTSFLVTDSKKEQKLKGDFVLKIRF